MAIIAVPSILSFTNVDALRLRRSTNKLVSRYTGQSQKVSYPYAVWMLEGKLREYQDLQAGIIRSFLTQLDGTMNTFRLPVPGYKKPDTIYGSTVGTNDFLYVNANAAERASSITIQETSGRINMPFLNDGDFITIQDELKLVVGSCALNATGLVTVNFKPALRKAVLFGAGKVKIFDPTCLMEAASDDIAEWAISPPIRQSSTFDAIEAISI